MNKSVPFPPSTFLLVFQLVDREPIKMLIDNCEKTIISLYATKPKIHMLPSGFLCLLGWRRDEEVQLRNAFECGDVNLSRYGIPIKGGEPAAIRASFTKDQKHISITTKQFSFVKTYFCYYQSLLYWGTDPGLVATAAFGESATIDAVYFATFLSEGPHLTSHTPFSNVKQIPFGCTVKITECGYDFNSTENIFQLDGLSPEPAGIDWENSLLELIKRSILNYVEGKQNVGFMVSGGIDSSLLFQASRLCSDPLARVTAIYLDYADSATADEREYLMSLVGESRDLLVIDMTKSLKLDPELMTDEIPVYPEPHREHITCGMWRELLPYLEERGIQRVISGFGGDQLFFAQANTPLHLWSGKRPMRPSDWLQELYIWSKARRTTCWQSIRLLLRDGVSAILSHDEKRMMRDLCPYSTQDHDLQCWLPRFLEHLEPSRRFQAFSLIHSSTAPERALFHPDLDLAYPYTDLDIQRFCLRVPFGEHLGNGWDRYLERRIASRLGVPKEIAWRDSKGGLIEPLIKACRKAATPLKQMMKELRASRLGLISSERANGLLTKTLVGDETSADKLLHLYMVECWLRTRNEPSIRAI